MCVCMCVCVVWLSKCQAGYLLFEVLGQFLGRCVSGQRRSVWTSSSVLAMLSFYRCLPACVAGR